MEIEDNVNNPKWKEIPCTCDHSSVLTKFPIKDCIHCKCELAENSIPKNNFNSIDKNDNEIVISKIKVIRGSKYDDCIGWTF